MIKRWISTLVLLFSLLNTGETQSIKTLEGLVSITFYEQTVVPLDFTLEVNSTELNTQLADPLSNGRSDFQGWNGNEFYDVYYSNSDGAFNMNGGYISITARFDRTGTGGGLNIRGIGLNFINGISLLANEVSSISFAGNYAEGSEERAVNCDLSNWSTMGNTSQTNERLRITVGIKDIITAFNYSGCRNDGFSIEVNGTTYDEKNPSGIEVIKGAMNCDSLVRVNLDFKDQVTRSETYLGCQGDDYQVLVNGTMYNEFNPIGTELINDINGSCDTLVMIDLTFNSEANRLESYTGCQGDDYSITINETTYNELNPSGLEMIPSSQGCDTLVRVALEFLDCTMEDISCEVYVPNAFSPNDDGLNDFFQIYLGQNCLMDRFTFQVFNRWGAMVYTSNDPEFNWDGKVKGSPLDNGILVWKMEYQLIEFSTPIVRAGSIMVLN